MGTSDVEWMIGRSFDIVIEADDLPGDLAAESAHIATHGKELRQSSWYRLWAIVFLPGLRREGSTLVALSALPSLSYMDLFAHKFGAAGIAAALSLTKSTVSPGGAALLYVRRRLDSGGCEYWNVK